MARRLLVLLLVALYVLLITLEATLVQANGNGNGNGDGGGNGSGKGQGDENGNGVGLGKKKDQKGKDEGKEAGKGADYDKGKGVGDDEKGKGKGVDEKGKGEGDDDKGKGKGDDDKGKGKGDEGKGKDQKGNEGKGKDQKGDEGKGKDQKGDEGKGKDQKGDEGKGNDQKGNEGNGKDHKGDDGKGKGKGKGEAARTHYQMVSPVETTGQEQAMCLSKGRCNNKTLTCPKECSVRKPKQANKQKGCFIDCSKCETTCKYRRPNCEGYGSVCYDPRFVGGDGVMFYFHGAKGENFALVSDEDLHINAHFIGSRPEGRKRDFTWVQALAVMFDAHTLVIAARRVTKWDNNVDALLLRWDGADVIVPTDGEAEWRPVGSREVVVERTAEANGVRVTVDGLVEMDVKVTPIGAEENRVHRYELPADDAFAHLETQFRFKSLTEEVEGVLGKTYQPGYVSPVKVGVPMPLMGGEDKYHTPSFLSHLCALCIFRRPPVLTGVTDHVTTSSGTAQF